jgi:N6-adenosine-specific RNA methylase IME4
MSTLFEETSIAAPPRVGLYQTIMADPPWNEAGGGKIKRGADRHYPLMKTRNICALPVGTWAAPDAHCYVWVTNNYLPDGLAVLAAWGFRYVTKIDWYKGYFQPECYSILRDGLRESRELESPQLIDSLAVRVFHDMCDEAGGEDLDAELQVGLGQYFRGCTESCLFGVRGTVPYRTRPNGKRAQGRTGFHAPRLAHSVKPEKFRQMVELVSPGPYLEMFARRPADGWDVWGNQAPTEALEMGA